MINKNIENILVCLKKEGTLKKVVMLYEIRVNETKSASVERNFILCEEKSVIWDSKSCGFISKRITTKDPRIRFNTRTEFTTHVLEPPFKFGEFKSIFL